jgi:hypothetical protein
MLINYSHASFFLTLPVLAPRPWIIVPCAQPSNLAAYTPAFTLRWAGCLTPSTTLVWYGERCGADFSLIQWTGVYAIDKASGQLVPNCHSHYTDPQYRPGTPFGNAVFGGCGVAPTSARCGLEGRGMCAMELGGSLAQAPLASGLEWHVVLMSRHVSTCRLCVCAVTPHLIANAFVLASRPHKRLVPLLCLAP